MESELERAIEAAHARGDEAALARLQAEYRATRLTTRVTGPGSIGLRESRGPSPEGTSSGSPPKVLYLSWRAQEDLAEFDLGAQGHLEQGGIVLGFVEPDRDRVVVEQLRRNLFVKPYSPDETTVDVDSMALFDTKGCGRAIGTWHTHVYPEDPVKASEGDLETWRRTAADLGEPVYVGLVVGPEPVWSSGFPSKSWEDPIIGAWHVNPEGRVRDATISCEPAWLAELRSQVRFRRREEQPHA